MFFGRDLGQNSIVYYADDIGGANLTLSVLVDFGDYGYVACMRQLGTGHLVVSTVNNSSIAGRAAISISVDPNWETCKN